MRILLTGWSFLALLLWILLIVDVGESKHPNVPFHKPISIPLDGGQYAEIPTGNPGKYNKYRVDYNLNETYIYDVPASYSQTFNEFSEIFYLGDVKVRLSVKYGYPPESCDPRGITTVRHDGILGMGASSELWKYWSSATLSSSKIELGTYNTHLYVPGSFSIAFSTTLPSVECTYTPTYSLHQQRQQQLSLHSIPLSSSSSSPPSSIQHNPHRNHSPRHYTLILDPSSEISYFPQELYHLDTFRLEYNQIDCQGICDNMLRSREECLTLCSFGGLGSWNGGDPMAQESDSVHQYSITVSKIDYVATVNVGRSRTMSKINTLNPQEIRLGRIFTDKLVIYYDVITGQRIAKPSFSRFRESHTGLVTNAYLGLALCIAYVAWLLTANSEPPNVEHNRIFFVLVQLYGQILIFSTLAYNIYGIYIARFYVHLVNSRFTWFYDVSTVVIPIFSVLNIISISRAFALSRPVPRNAKKASGGSGLPFPYDDVKAIQEWSCREIRDRMLFETGLLASLWVTLLENHYDTGGMLCLVGVSTILACTHLINSLTLYVRGSRYCILAVLLFLASLYFLVDSNLMPYLRLQMFNNPFSGEFCVIYCVVFVFVPSLFVFAHMERAILLYLYEIWRKDVKKS